jgi:uncharacterized protein (DUF2062 family)
MIVALVSLVASHALYWLSSWHGSTSDQYSIWAPLVIGIFFCAATLTGGIVLIVMKVLEAYKKADPKKRVRRAGDFNV